MARRPIACHHGHTRRHVKARNTVPFRCRPCFERCGCSPLFTRGQRSSCPWRCNLDPLRASRAQTGSLKALSSLLCVGGQKLGRDDGDLIVENADRRKHRETTRSTEDAFTKCRSRILQGRLTSLTDWYVAHVLPDGALGIRPKSCDCVACMRVRLVIAEQVVEHLFKSCGETTHRQKQCYRCQPPQIR